MSKRQKIAAHNRDELLNAAEECFRIHGINVPLQVVIDHAGVGRATFYRNFCDRKALISALLERAITQLEQKAGHFQQFEDGLFRLIEGHIGQLPKLAILQDFWRVIDRQDPIMLKIYERRNNALNPLIENAIEQKMCRADLTADDYAMVTAMLGSSFQGHEPEEQTRLAKRAIELLFHGIQIQKIRGIE